MNDLAEAIRTHWSGDSTLTNLLPVDRLATGTYRSVDPVRPFVTLAFPGADPGDRANDGSTIQTVTARLTITTGDSADDYTTASQLAAAIRDRFESAGFELPDDAGSVLDVRVLFGDETQAAESGEWTINLDLRCKVFRP